MTDPSTPRVKADFIGAGPGDPSLHGAIAEQIRRPDDLAIESEIVPGVSAFQAAAAALKIEYTPAVANQTVILTRAVGRTGLRPNEELSASAAHKASLCLFLSAAQMPEAVSALMPQYGDAAPVVVAHRVSWPDESYLHCTPADVAERMAEAGITMTALAIVGPMLGTPPAGTSHLYDAAYSHAYRKARPVDGEAP